MLVYGLYSLSQGLFRGCTACLGAIWGIYTTRLGLNACLWALQLVSRLV